MATVALTVTPVNDAPTLTATGLDPTFVEGGSVVDLFDSVSVDPIETGQTIDQVVIRVSQAVDGSSELVMLDSSGVPLIDGAVGVIPSRGFGFSVSVATSVATITFDTTGASTAEIESMIDALRYRHNGGAPTETTRTVSILSLVDSGGATGNLSASSDIAVVGVNAAPLLDLDADDSTAAGTGFAASWTEDGGPVVVVDSDASLSDLDHSTLQGLTVQITNALDGALESLSADTSGTSIAASYDAGTSTLTLSGSDSVANYQQVLRTVAYDNASDDPTTTLRSLSFLADDGTDMSSVAIATVSIAAVEDAPLLGANALSIAEGGSVVLTGSDLSASDADSDPAALQFQVTGLSGGRFENVGNPGVAITSFTQQQVGDSEIRFVHDGGEAAPGWSMSVTDGSLVDGPHAASVTFSNSNDAPAANVDAGVVAEGGTVTIDLADDDLDPDDGLDLASIEIVSGPANGSVVLNGDGSIDYTHDGSETSADAFTYRIRDASGALSNVASVSLSVTPAEDAPIVTGAGLDPTFTEGDSAVDVFDGVAVDPVESGQTIDSVVLTVSNVADGSQEWIVVDGTTFGLVDGASGTTSSRGYGWSVDVTGGLATITLSTTGASATEVAGELGGLCYHNASEDPTAGTRVATIASVTDSGGGTATPGLTSTITIVAVDDASTLDLDADDSTASGTSFAGSWTQGGGPVAIVDGDAVIADVDSADLTRLVVTLVNPMDGAHEQLTADTSGTNIVASYDAGTGTLTLSGVDSVANYQTVLGTIRYDNAASNPNAVDRTLRVVAEDATGAGPVATSTIQVSATTNVGLVGHYQFDEGTGTVAVDSTAFAWHGNHVGPRTRSMSRAASASARSTSRATSTASRSRIRATAISTSAPATSRSASGSSRATSPARRRASSASSRAARPRGTSSSRTVAAASISWSGTDRAARCSLRAASSTGTGTTWSANARGTPSRSSWTVSRSTRTPLRSAVSTIPWPSGRRQCRWRARRPSGRSPLLRPRRRSRHDRRPGRATRDRPRLGRLERGRPRLRRGLDRGRRSGADRRPRRDGRRWRRREPLLDDDPDREPARRRRRDPRRRHDRDVDRRELRRGHGDAPAHGQRQRRELPAGAALGDLRQRERPADDDGPHDLGRGERRLAHREHGALDALDHADERWSDARRERPDRQRRRLDDADVAGPLCVRSRQRSGDAPVHRLGSRRRALRDERESRRVDHELHAAAGDRRGDPLRAPRRGDASGLLGVGVRRCAVDGPHAASISFTNVNDAPEIDLDADDSSGATGGDHDATFVENDPPVAVIGSDVTILDPDSPTMQGVQLVGSFVGSVDGGLERYAIGGEVFEIGTPRTVSTVAGGTTFDLAFTGSTLAISIGAGSGAVADFESLLGTMTYEHAGENPTAGARSFSLAVTDDLGQVSSSVTSSIDVIAVDDAPVSQSDSGVVAEGGSVVLDLAANDDDDDDGLDLASIEIVSGPSRGSVVVNSDGSVQYTHDGSETSADSFTYRIRDASGLPSNVSTVSLTITAVDDAPILGNNGLTIAEGGAIVLDASHLSASDADDAAGDLDFLVSGLVGGQFEEVGNPGVAITGFTQQQVTDGAIRFVHDGGDAPPGYAITVSDGSTSDGPHAATIVFTNVNDAPVLDLDADDSSGAVGGGHVSTFVENGAPVAVVGTDVSIVDTDSASFQGGRVVGTFLGSVDGPDERYALNGEVFTIGTARNVWTTIGGTTFELDWSGTGLSIAIESGPGTASDLESLLASMTYQHVGEDPTAGARSFSFAVVDDAAAESNPVVSTIDVTPVNDAPILGSNELTVAEGESVVLTTSDLSASDVDGPNGSLGFAVTGLSGGRFELVAAPGVPIASFTQQQVLDGEVRFVHDGGEAPPGYSITVSDGSTSDGPHAATIVFTNVNDAPVLDLDADDSSAPGDDFIAVYESGSPPVRVTDGDAAIVDVDSPQLVGLTVTITNLLDPGAEALAADTTGTSISATYQSGTGVLTLSGSDSRSSYEQVLRTVTYQNTAASPDPTDRSLVFVVDDGIELSNAAESTVRITELPPLAGDDAASVDEGASVTLDLVANDADPEGSLDAGSIEIVSGPANGVVTLRGDGRAEYVHDGSETTGDAFRYTIRDATGRVSNQATVLIDVDPVNDAPTATTHVFALDEDQPLAALSTSGVLVGASDAEGDGLTATLVSPPDWAESFSLRSDGSFDYTPRADWHGSDTFYYTVSDGVESSVVTAVTIDVLSVNDAPVIEQNAGLSLGTEREAVIDAAPTSRERRRRRGE